MAGHPYAGLARFTAAAKSPLTGGIGETRCEGPFGMALKRSGADAIIVHGVAAAPTSVLIEATTGAVTFHDATSIWGQPVSTSVDALEAAFGPAEPTPIRVALHTAVIGPAGERLVRYASIVTDRTYQAARMGMGAVMGSKRLKAIVIRGENAPPVADPAACAALTTRYATDAPELADAVATRIHRGFQLGCIPTASMRRYACATTARVCLRRPSTIVRSNSCVTFCGMPATALKPALVAPTTASSSLVHPIIRRPEPAAYMPAAYMRRHSPRNHRHTGSELRHQQCRGGAAGQH